MNVSCTRYPTLWPSPTPVASAPLSMQHLNLPLLGLRADVKNIVPANECVPIFGFELAIDILFCLPQHNVHVTVQAFQHAAIVCPIVQLDNHGLTNHLFDEVAR